uniref:SURF1-like protein n=1 Tax=Culicoides sonorensis TaxID=179676 RepID=A0A336N5E4_CULSO
MFGNSKQSLISLGRQIGKRSPFIVPSRNATREHLNFLKETKKNIARPGDFKEPTEKIGIGGYFLFALPVTAFGLGCWQVKRKIWKENLIKELESKTKLGPVPIPENLTDVDRMEYHTVKVTGEFLHDRELLLGPRSLITDGDMTSDGGLMTQKQETIGFHVITPLKLEGREEMILVNRGWIPASKKNPRTRPEGQIEGTVELQGVVRLAEVRPQFTPDHRENMYFYRDLVKMCKHTGAEPVFIDATFDSTVKGGPIGGQTRVSLRNEHNSYIITWFSLSAFTGWLWYSKIFKKIMARK